MVNLVFLDFFMPGINGITLLRKMRAEKIKCAVIIITAACQFKKMQKAGSNGLAKGLNDKTLETILTYLKGHSSQEHTCETLSKASNLSKVTVPVT